MPAPLCSFCHDRGYTYRGGRRVRCTNFSCHARTDFNTAENRRTIAETKARMALTHAHNNYTYGAAIREATRAGLHVDIMRKLTGLSIKQIRQMQGGQTSFLG